MHREEDIAVIGLGGRFPGASSPQQLWLNSCEYKESLHHFSLEELRAAGVNEGLLTHPDYIRVKGILEHIDLFDAEFFSLSEQEATLLDPQHRMLLLCAWEALEHAGYAPRQIQKRVGVFASTGMSLYLIHQILGNPDCLPLLDEYQVLLANDKDFLATRISYLFNLKGPSVTVQTGCSSSLVCVHYAVQSLLNGECDMALAGGVSISIPQEQGYLYRKEMIGSADGHCYAFDKKAQGTIKSNGVGTVVLKLLGDALRDGDTIYSVIRGSAINNDGAQKVGYTAPNAAQQSAVIQEALNMAEVDPCSIAYIETHGTGTILGDPIEIAALKKAFAPYDMQEQHCALVSLKSNIGHLDVAAGIASLLRASLALYHGKIPPSLNFSELNPKISLEKSPFYINTAVRAWPDNHLPRCVGVSAFGVGGTNAHVILQEAPQYKAPKATTQPVLSMISGRTRTALQNNINHLIEHCLRHPETSMQDMAYTLRVGREAMSYRACIVAEDLEQWIEQAQSIDVSTIKPVAQAPALVFMFSGQGAQYPGMGRGLCADPDFAQAFDAVIEAFSPYLSYDLRACIHPQEENEASALQLQQTAVAQPALFAIEYALAQSLIAKGLKPKALLGHSIGEYVAATLAGVFTLSEVARLIALRGRLVQSLPKGTMIAVHASANTLRSWLPDSVDIALENSPINTVIAGTDEAMTLIEHQLQERQLHFQRLHTSHAFHSRMLDPILDAFRQEVASVKRSAPTIPMISNVTGTWLSNEEACSVDYWVSQLRQSVKFKQGIELLQQQGAPLFLEVGPGRTLYSFVTQQGINQVTNTLRHPFDAHDDRVQQQKTFGFLWQQGFSLQYKEQHRRIPLPTYSWDLKRYWLERPQTPAAPATSNAESVHESQDLRAQIKKAWKQALGAEPNNDAAHFFNQGGHSLSAIHFIDLLPEVLRAEVQVVHLYQYPTFSQFLNFCTAKHQTPITKVSFDEELLLDGSEL